MGYTVHIDHFEGPLDLLLQLIEAQELEITTVSLLQVTEPYVAHVRAHHGAIAPEELADFLVIAAKLVYLKSKALLPELQDPSLDEGPDLEEQLRLYKQYVEAAKVLGELARQGRTSFSKRAPFKLAQPEGFIAPPPIDVEVFAALYRGVIRKLEPLIALPKAAVERAFTLEEKIEQLRDRVSKLMHVSFHRVLADASSRQEMVVSFLALLELVKQRIVKVKQPTLFEDIHLEAA